MNDRSELDYNYNSIQSKYEQVVDNYGRIKNELSSTFLVNNKTVNIDSEYEKYIGIINQEITSINELKNNNNYLCSDYNDLKNDDNVVNKIMSLESNNEVLRTINDDYENILSQLEETKRMLDNQEMPKNETGGLGGGNDNNGGGSSVESKPDYTEVDIATAYTSVSRDTNATPSCSWLTVLL